jgi:hypothetical protein
MKSAVGRWTAFGLFVAVLVAAAYLFWTTESVSRSAAASADNFDDRAASVMLSIMELRMAQQAYVAAGQGDEFWGSRVAARIASLRDELRTLGGLGSSLAARSGIDEAIAIIDDFERMDARAREYARSNQRLLASDLIYSDGLDKTTAMVQAIEQARADESRAADALVRAARQRQVMVAGGFAVAGLALGLLLAPAPRRLQPAVAPPADTPADSGQHDRLLLRDARDPVPPLPADTPPSMRQIDSDPTDPLNLGHVASLCTDLARLIDTRSLPAVLERTARVLDANGVVLWIADPDGRELNPIVTHGYPAQLVTRLGIIPRDAQNATAAAFRTALLQTVDSDSTSMGAIAVPLMTPTGCVGVMAAEVLHGGEKQDAKLAAAAIVAAQLATLVGPPSSRPQARPEAARA